ncbi:hypothetical protein OCA08_06115 [Bacillus cereus]|nr:hypothetical protein [Bacillus cereus]
MTKKEDEYIQDIEEELKKAKEAAIEEAPGFFEYIEDIKKEN